MQIEHAARHEIIAFAVALAISGGAAAADTADAQGAGKAHERFPSGSVIFFHPDGTGANHWSAPRR